MRRSWFAGWVAALLLSGVGGAAVEADEGFGYQLAHDMMSPFCPGRTLAQCPSNKAEELRVWILTQEAAGASQEEVEAELVARYGGEIWPAPSAAGLSGAGAYGIPLAMLIVGGPVAFLILRRLTATTGPAPLAPAAPPPIDADLAAEIDRELRERGT